MLQRFLTTLVRLLKLSNIIPRSFYYFGTFSEHVFLSFRKTWGCFQERCKVFSNHIVTTSYLKLILPNQYIKFHSKTLNDHLPKNSTNIGQNVNGKTILAQPNGKFYNFQQKFPTGKCAYYHWQFFAAILKYDQMELVLVSFGKLVFLWVNGKSSIGTELTIRHFCLSFAQTVNEPVSPFK